MITHKLDKKSIESLIGSVFVMQALGEPIEFEVGENYRFEVKFKVQAEHIEMLSGNIFKLKGKD